MSYRSLGQTTPAPTPSSSISPLMLVAGGLIVLAVVGAKGAERHQRALYANRRARRNGRRRKR